jgi:acyl carrier protein
MTDAHDPVQTRLLEVLRPFLRLLPSGAPIPLAADLGSLGLDSLQAIDLLMAIEQEFGLQIPDEKLSADTFANAGHLLALVREATSEPKIALS